MSNKELILNIFCCLANLIVIILCFAIAIFKDWWLCLLLPLILHFKIRKEDENEQIR